MKTLRLLCAVPVYTAGLVTMVLGALAVGLAARVHGVTCRTTRRRSVSPAPPVAPLAGPPPPPPPGPAPTLDMGVDAADLEMRLNAFLQQLQGLPSSSAPSSDQAGLEPAVASGATDCTAATMEPREERTGGRILPFVPRDRKALGIVRVDTN